MNKEQKKKLDRAFRKEKIRKYSIAIAGVLIFLSFCFFVLYLSIPKEIKDIQKMTGVTIKISATPSRYGNNAAMIVKLNDGQEVRVALRNGITYRPNSKVELKKTTTTTGFSTYKFINYLQ